MKEQTILLLKYNQDDNNQVISILEGLTQEERLAERKSYFKSLHGLLEHVVLAGLFFQKMLLSGMQEHSNLATKYLNIQTEYGEINFPDFSELKAMSQEIGNSFIAIAEKLTEEELNKTVTVTTPRGTSEMQVWFMLYQYINHSTHHKGQIMQILEEMGMEANFGGIKPKYE